MTIKKYVGKTKDEAIALAKEELGPSTVIMNIKEVKPKGLFGFFQKNEYEVTAAIEDDAVPVKPIQPIPAAHNFDQVVDDPITIPPMDEGSLKDAFAAVNEVMEREYKRQESDAETSTKSDEKIKQTPDVVKDEPEETPKEMLRRNPAPAPKPAETRGEPAFMPLESMEFVEKISDDTRENSQAIYKMIYKMLLDHEVDEHYINQFMEDEKRVSQSTNQIDFLISNIYQKMILKLGQPEVISLAKKKPKVVFFIGPTGVGKTTTIAKIASKFKLEQDKKVALLTADTYRIAATDQLRVYANILGISLNIVYSSEDITKEVQKLSDCDLILVDTAGFSHKNEDQRRDTKQLLEALPNTYEKQIYLVLSATTKYKDLLDITDMYKDLCTFALIFTKLDETNDYGNILNIKLKTAAPISYVTNGQNVPDDISVLDTQKLVKQLLGGR